jgi:hypothetical protein
MKKNLFVKVIGLIVIALVVIIGGGIIYVVYFLPNIPVPNLKVELTPERIARGKYLAYHVAVCMDCHSTREWNKYAAPMVPGTDGKGGETFDQKFGFPGAFYSTNITPYYLSGFSDGEIYRAITSGVGKGNRPLFNVMPYLNYGSLDNEDIYSIIAFIRTLPSISYQAPASKADFPVNIILHTIPQKPVPTPLPPKTDSVNYGKYLMTACGCMDCHTPFTKGKLVMDMAYAGGREFNMPFGVLRSTNITPDMITGIGKYTKEDFVILFKSYDIATYSPPLLTKSDSNTVMPWTMYGGMETGDLEAMYVYERTLKPISNKVIRFSMIK